MLPFCNHFVSSREWNLGNPDGSKLLLVSKSPANWATSVNARIAAFCGEVAVPAVKIISLKTGNVSGSQARAATVGIWVLREKSLSMS